MVWDDKRQCWTDNATQAHISETTASNNQAARLRDAIRAIPYHYFNDHARCWPWCKAKEDPAHRPKVSFMKKNVSFPGLFLDDDELNINSPTPCQ